MLGPILIALLVVLLLRNGLSLARIVSQTASSTRHIVLALPFRIYSELLLPPWSHINETIMNAWALKYDLFERSNSSVLMYVGFLPNADVQVLVADKDGAREVFQNKRAFGKPIADYEILKFFGPNVVTLEGDEWRRHRKLTGPSFSESNNELVWAESVTIIENWFNLLDSREDAEGNCADVDTVGTTLRMALMVICASAFGVRYSWPSDSEAEGSTSDPPPPGRKLGLITALKGVLDGTIVKLLLPKWAYSLPIQYPKYVKLCFDELEGTLRDMIRDRRAEKSAGVVERHDLFSMLLKGDDGEDEDGTGKVAALSIEETLGNLYIFMLAGHETTAHTLAFIFTLLALYPEHQQPLYDEAHAAFGDRTSSYDDYTSLPYALATVNEALRLFPPVLFIPKIALEDTTIPAHTAPRKGTPEPTEVFVPKGSRVAIVPSGVHYNPNNWDSPFEFRPSRFIDTPTYTWPRDCFVPFSGGIRACLGQKFSLVESVALISHIVLNYSLSIPEHLKASYALKEGESDRDRRERIFKVTNGITLTPGELPLVFRRREGRRKD